jgi:hypothetical protein
MERLTKRFPLYATAIKLYPKPYGEQMLQTLADMPDNAPDKARRAGIWARLVFDFPFTVIGQQLSYAGGVMTHEMPKYVKRNAIIGGAMLVPFVLSLTAHVIYQTFYGRSPYNSWLWSTAVLKIWVLWLPIAAAALTLAVFLARQAKAEHISLLKALFDIHHDWPLIGVLWPDYLS